MKRLLLCFVLLGALIVPSSCQKRVDRTGLVKLTKQVYAMIATGPTAVEGLGANSGFVVGRDGVLVIDGRYTPALANDLLKAIRSVTSAPIAYVVNTHYHPDHTWGNMVFKAQGAVIIACPGTREALTKYSPIYLEFYKERSKDAFEMLRDIEVSPPDTTVVDNQEIDLGGIKVVIRCLGPAHTVGDCVVIVPQGRIAFAGGLLSNGYHPNMGDPAADFDNWITVLDQLGRMNIKDVVPGQGKVCGREAFDVEKKYIVTLRNQCEQNIRRMVPLEQASSSIVIPGAEGYLQPNIFPFNVQAIYRRAIPEIVRPDFAFDMPAEFQIMDGGGNTKSGFIRWSMGRKGGSIEIETRWLPTARRELIPQDIAEEVAQHVAAGKSEMKIEGSTRIDIGGEQAVASYGTWKYRIETMLPGGGTWTWASVVRGDKLYSIRLATNVAVDQGAQKEAMDYLKKVAATFRITPRVS